MTDKNIEKKRYDDRAIKLIEANNFEVPLGLHSYMMEPIDSYKKNLLANVFNGARVLEIGAGMGENTEFLLNQGFNVHATDISSKSVEFLKKKYASYSLFEAEVADMESLPFKDNSFDVICSAGSLSYGDNSIVMNEIYRVLVKGGIFIAIDSLNNNPIYKLNRYIHFLLGNRSKSTLQRMPTIKLLEKYTVKFDNVEVAYFGSLTWLFPILRKFLNDDLMKEISSSFDKKINIKKSAFKFIIKAIK
jgi:ubiquinone/menaquinone biosynthesis C-methylase UbiE